MHHCSGVNPLDRTSLTGETRTKSQQPENVMRRESNEDACLPAGASAAVDAIPHVWMAHGTRFGVMPPRGTVLTHFFHREVDKSCHDLRAGLEEIHCGGYLFGLGCGYPHHPAGIFAGFFVS